jgi:hypothetical protein
MLQITEGRGSANRRVYRLAGEITSDQVRRLEELVRAALDSGHELTLDVSGVWRVDRLATRLVAGFCSSPPPGVRLEGADQGLLAWLHNVSSGAPRAAHSNGEREHDAGEPDDRFGPTHGGLRPCS